MSAWRALLLAAVSACLPRVAQAYSDPAQFDAPALEAGGAGRFYTGSPADGYACDSCHSGGSKVRATLSGVPARYVPGATYTIRVDWPTSLEHAAAVFELSDERGRGAGELVLPPAEHFVARELCEPSEQGVLAATLYPTERGRTIVATADCGAHAIRAQWTAPSSSVGPIWLTGALLASNHDGELTGDGVTTFAERIPALGQELPVTEAYATCSITRAGERSRGLGTWLAWLAAVLFTIRCARPGWRTRTLGRRGSRRRCAWAGWREQSDNSQRAANGC